MSRLWDKGEPVDDLVLRYTVGDDHLLDQRLVPFDVAGSVAHAAGLVAAGHLTEAERRQLASALEELAAEHAAGDWSVAREEEDCHTALESRLVQRLGDLGKKIHLGRSRNDQVLAALRLYLLDVLADLRALTGSVVTALQALSNTHEGVPLPGYTHQQRAMPSSVSLWAMGFASELEDDAEGLAACVRRVRRSPLGSAAGYGVPDVLGLDRTVAAAALDMPVQEPVTAVQLSRGKAEAGVAFECSLLMQDLGRIAADLCLFATQEYGFVTLPQRFTTGSSIMPQKRNPDVFELVRARSAGAPAELQAILALTSKMTSGYHRDLQLLKAPLFRLVDSTADTLKVMAHALPHVRFDQERTTAAMDSSLFATEQAYRLVTEEGLPFRDAYRRVAEQQQDPPVNDEGR